MKSGQENLVSILSVSRQDDLWHTKVSDVRAQLRFLEEVETLKKKRNDEEEKERLLRWARVNWTKMLHEFISLLDF